MSTENTLENIKFVISEFSKNPPPRPDDYDWMGNEKWGCFYCDTPLTEKENSDPTNHKQTCAWRMATELMEQL